MTRIVIDDVNNVEDLLNALATVQARCYWEHPSYPRLPPKTREWWLSTLAKPEKAEEMRADIAAKQGET